MRPQALQHVAHLLASMHELKALATVEPDRATDAVQSWLAHARGALEGFHSLGILSAGELDEWTDRFLLAGGLVPSEQLGAEPERERVSRAGISSAASVAVGEGLDFTPSEVEFLRLVIGPDRQEPYHGGAVRLIAIEVYRDRVAIQWLMYPPDARAKFADTLTALKRDTDLLPHDEQSRQLERLASQLRLLGPSPITLTDDQATAYSPDGGDVVGHQGLTLGRKFFTPGLPAQVAQLHVDMGGVRFTVDLK